MEPISTVTVHSLVSATGALHNYVGWK